jgi:hypothetical protein
MTLLTWLCDTIEAEYGKPKVAHKVKQNMFYELNKFGRINIVRLCYDSFNLFVAKYSTPNLHLSFFSNK